MFWGKPVGRLSANKWPTVGQQSVNSRPTDGRQSANSQSTVGRQTADSQSTDSRQSGDRFFGELFFTITKLAKTNIRKQVGGSLLTSILSLGRVFGPTIAKTIGLSALAGAASTGASQIVKKIAGKGVKTGGFLIPQNKIDKLIANKHLLTVKQKRDILTALQSGSGIRIKPTKTQSGGFLGTLLASIGIPLVLKALTGKGAPKIGLPPKPPQGGKGAPRMGVWQPPPFMGSWNKKVGMGKKKPTKKREKVYY